MSNALILNKMSNTYRNSILFDFSIGYTRIYPISDLAYQIFNLVKKISNSVSKIS